MLKRTAAPPLTFALGLTVMDMQIADLSQVATSLSALLTLTIGAVVAYIAYQQWRTNYRKEERESRTARLAVYRRAKALLRHVDYTREVRSDLYDDFCEAAAEADFLFPQSLTNWLGDIESNAAQWRAHKEDLDSASEQTRASDLRKKEADMEKLVDELQEAHCALRDKFAEYMR